MVRRVVSNALLFDQVSELVAEGNNAEIPTKGNSMLPFIVGGEDTLILTAPKSLTVGDIVMAKINDSNYVVHRIIEISAEKITLMGDGNIAACETCTLSQIKAKVIRIVHKGKEIDCTSKKELRKARLWRKLLPIRRYLLAIRRIFS